MLLVILFSLATATVCRAESRHFRNEALSAMQAIRKKAPPLPLAEEFTSIVDTFSRAEELAGQSMLDEAEKMYRLTLLKYSLYEKKVNSLPTPPVNEKPSSQPAASVEDQPEESVEKTPVLEPSRIPGNDAPESIAPPDDTASPLHNVSPGRRAETEDDQDREIGPVSSHLIIGEKMVYTVKKRQSLRMLGAKLGVNWRTIARENGLNPATPLTVGQKLRINTRRIVPRTRTEGIVINIPDRTLYLFRDKKLEKALPVGLGMPKNSMKESWQTPTGTFTITSKIKDPTWFVPSSIQREMKQQGKVVQTEVPPGKKNPLGKYALKTSLSGILIHGTTRPESIFTFSSHGCIRVLPANIEEIFADIRINTAGEIIYQPVKMALSDDGRVFIEVHGDIYGRHKNLEEVAKELINRHNAQKKVDWNKVRSSLQRKTGIPEDVTLLETSASAGAGREGPMITTASH